MKKSNRWLIPAVCVAVFAGASPVVAQTRTPKPGSAERKAVLDALRVPVAKQYRQTPVFENVRLKIKNGWAFVSATAKNKQGKPLGGTGDNFFDLSALLQKTGTGWQVKSIGSSGGTDAIDDAKAKFPQAPREIFTL